METVFRSWLYGSMGFEAARVLVDLSLRATLLCLLAGAVSLGLRNASAYARKMIWLFTLIGLILLPPLLLINPVWNLSLLPQLDRWGEALSIFGTKAVDQGLPAGGGLGTGTGGAGGQSGDLPMLPALPRWASALLLAWAIGALAVAGWYLLSMLYMRRIMGEMEEVGSAWADLAGRIEKRLGIEKRVPIFRSRLSGSAMTTGIVHPVIILPGDAETWPVDKRRLVLSHELAHVKRRDVLIELVVSFALVLHWFNPFAWVAATRLRIERERDCDNAVLNSGEKPSDYASLLLDIAADLAAARKPAWQLSTISQNSNLKDRLLCILNPRVNRSTENRRCTMRAVALILAVIVPLSLFGVWDTRAQEKKKPAPSPSKTEVKDKINASWAEIEAKEGSAAAAVAAVIDEDGIKAGMKAFSDLKKKDKHYFDEKEFNLLGYRYLYNGETKKAIGVFKMNVEAYPDSWNVYDSLGEAYANAGDLEKAEKYYKKSIELNPENENGMKMLKKMQHKEQMKQEQMKKEQLKKEKAED